MAPSKIGRYEIKAEIGRGGMATVYRAFDPISKREVAIKILTDEKQKNLLSRVRFQRELRMITLLEHPAIVPVYDVGEHESQLYFVMRYMSGGSLADLIKKRKLSLQDTARIIERVASALHYAHNRRIVHRDLKAGNILFDSEGNPYLTDFSAAKVIMGESISTTDHGGIGVVGTSAYASPEQAQGKPVDRRSDVYGMGVLIYEMLTGVQPYRAEDPFALYAKHIYDPVPDILEVEPDLPIEISVIIKKAMAKKKEDRYASALDLARALFSIAFGENKTLPAFAFDRKALAASSRRRRVRSFFGMIVLLAALLTGGYLFRGQLMGFFATPTLTVTPSLTPSTTPLPPTPMPVSMPTAEPTSTPVPPTPTAVPPPGHTDKIAFISVNQIYFMNPDGTDLIQVRTDNSLKSNLQWLPDGSLLYTAHNCVYMLDQSKALNEIMCFTAKESLEGFRISPDGKSAAISIDRTLIVVPFDRESLRKIKTRLDLSNLPERCVYSQYAFEDVQWSRDEKMLAALVVDTETGGGEQIYLLDVDISNCKTIGLVRRDKLPAGRFAFGSATIPSYDWDSGRFILLNDFVRNDGFGNLYVYDSQTQQGKMINPINGLCCYRDARWSPDGKYILFAFQENGKSEIQLYYVAYADLNNGQLQTPLPLGRIFTSARERPQIALKPVTNP